jgi:hypothetical protein
MSRFEIAVSSETVKQEALEYAVHITDRKY